MTNDELVEQNMKLAYKIAWKYYNKFDGKLDFEELQSVSFLGLVKAAKAFDKSRNISFSTFAYTSIKNEILMYYYYNKKYINTASLDFNLFEDISILDTLESDVDKQIYNNIDIMQLRIYIDMLPDFEKKVVKYYLQGYTMEQISSLFHCSINHISVTYRKAINRLRNKFSNCGKEEL